MELVNTLVELELVLVSWHLVEVHVMIYVINMIEHHAQLQQYYHKQLLEVITKHVEAQHQLIRQVEIMEVHLHGMEQVGQHLLIILKVVIQL